jgi:colanic acid/amylovoran biosynthesis glycosyltransferase
LKKIGLVLPEAPQYSETFFKHKIKGLQNSGFEVIVFSGKKTGSGTDFKNVSAYQVYKKSPVKQIFLFTLVLLKTFTSSPGRAKRLYSNERADGKSVTESLKSIYFNAHILPFGLDHLHFGFTTMAIGRENVAKAIGAGMSVSMRGYDINIYPLKNPGCYSTLWKRVEKVHTISSYLHTKALALGLPEEVPFEVITPAIELSSFSIKKDHGEIKSTPVILTVGRLNWIKDYETAISVMKTLSDRNVNFKYNIIGDGVELERLKFAVHSSGLNDKVVFHGKLGHEEINKKMEEADIYLQTSLEEGFCVSALEAQAKGLLCVVSDAEGLKENILDGVTGWIVPKRSPVKFADKIIEIMNMSLEERKRVTANARLRVESEFKIENQKNKFENFFP